MNIETLEAANNLDRAIRDMNLAIERIGVTLQRMKEEGYVVIVDSYPTDNPEHHNPIDQLALLPELREALQKAQVRLRYEVTELKKEFEKL